MKQQRDIKFIFLLIFLVQFSPLAIDIYLPAFPLMAQEFAVESVLIQDTIAWFMFSMGVGQLFAGPLADRFGRRPVALTGIMIYSISAMLAYYARTLDLLLIARLTQGFGACATSVAAFATVRDKFGPKNSGAMISYLNGAICVIPAVAPVFGAWLTAEFGWRANFSFMAGFALVVGILVFIGFKETRPDNTKITGRIFSFSRYLSILKQPIFLYHSSICMLSMAVILAYVTSSPVWLMESLGLDMVTFTYWFGANAVVNISTALIAPKFMQRYGSRKALNLGLMMLVAGGVIMLLLSIFLTAWAFMLPIILSSMGFSLVLGAAAGKALAPFGDRAGTAAALLGLLQMSGAGALISLTQRLDLTPPVLLMMHMWLLIPALILLHSRYGKKWHAIEI